MYYAFFARQWKGPVELRGLEGRNYSVVDYVTGKNLGTVAGPSAHLPVAFDGSLLMEVRPQ
jgi:alpha-galactosidase